MSRLLTSGGDFSLPYRMSSTNNTFERLEMLLGGKITLRPMGSLRQSKIYRKRMQFRRFAHKTFISDHIAHLAEEAPLWKQGRNDLFNAIPAFLSWGMFILFI